MRADKTERSLYFENLKGLLILTVVFGHILELSSPWSAASQIVYAAIYFFHMPLFILVSGYFSSAETSVQKLLSRLLVPYVLMQLVYAVSDTVLYEANFLRSFLVTNWGLWYLPALLVWRLVWPTLSRVPHILLLSILAAVLCGYIETFNGLISRIVYFFPFFIVGSYWAAQGGKDVALKVIRTWWPLIALTGLAAYGMFFAMDMTPVWLYGKIDFASLGAAQWWAGGLRLVLLAGAACGLALYIAAVPSGKSWLTPIGAGTLNIYLVHFLLLDILNTSGLIKSLSGTLAQHPLLTLLLAAAGAWLIARFLSLPAVQRACERVYRPHLARH